MNIYRSESHRNFTEAPIPGYRGYVPRFYTTESGLGSRYKEGTGRSFERFVNEVQTHRSAINPVDPEGHGPGSFIEGYGLLLLYSVQNAHG